MDSKMQTRICYQFCHSPQNDSKNKIYEATSNLVALGCEDPCPSYVVKCGLNAIGPCESCYPLEYLQLTTKYLVHQGSVPHGLSKRGGTNHRCCNTVLPDSYLQQLPSFIDLRVHLTIKDHLCPCPYVSPYNWFGSLLQGPLFPILVPIKTFVEVEGVPEPI